MNVFIIAAGLNFLAALIHVAVIFGGAAWYRFFGAGEQMARMSEAGHFYPTFITGLIVVALILFGLYALQAGQYFSLLPWTRIIFWLITTVFIIRAVVPFALASFVEFYRTPFMMWSSAIVGVYAAVHITAASSRHLVKYPS